MDTRRKYSADEAALILQNMQDIRDDVSEDDGEIDIGDNDTDVDDNQDTESLSDEGQNAESPVEASSDDSLDGEVAVGDGRGAVGRGIMAGRTRGRGAVGRGIMAGRNAVRRWNQGRGQGALLNPMVSANGTSWRYVLDNERNNAGRAAAHNILRQMPGITNYAIRNTVPNSAHSCFSLFFDEPMLRLIKNCTESEGKRVKGDNWNLSIEELENFIGLNVARGIVGGRTTPVPEFWSANWGNQRFIQTMSRDRFIDILRFLRFDLRAERRGRLVSDKFALVSSIWAPFIQNCQKAYKPHSVLTIDEQLLPCKCRCPFLQYIASKPDKFGIKFYLMVDVKTKYLYNALPYLGRENANANPEVSVPGRVVLKLIEPLEGGGYHLSMDNYFTSLELAQKLQEKRISLLGTMRHNRREIPPVVRQRLQLHETKLLKTNNDDFILTHYQCKPNKSVLLLSSLHKDVQIPVNDSNPKKKPETVLQYNKEKVGVDMLDSMLRKYSTKSASRRWPMHVFHNIVDMAICNAWIIYKELNGSSISRRQFIQKLVDEMTKDTPDRRRRQPPAMDPNAEFAERFDTRRQCKSMCNGNKTFDKCLGCLQPVCGKCSAKFCRNCYGGN